MTTRQIDRVDEIRFTTKAKLSSSSGSTSHGSLKSYPAKARVVTWIDGSRKVSDVDLFVPTSSAPKGEWRHAEYGLLCAKSTVARMENEALAAK